MSNKIDIEVSYEVKPVGKAKAIIVRTIDQEEVLKTINAIKEGQRIREIEGPKFYGATCGC